MAEKYRARETPRRRKRRRPRPVTPDWENQSPVQVLLALTEPAMRLEHLPAMPEASEAPTFVDFSDAPTEVATRLDYRRLVERLDEVSSSGIRRKAPAAERFGAQRSPAATRSAVGPPLRSPEEVPAARALPARRVAVSQGPPPLPKHPGRHAGSGRRRAAAGAAPAPPSPPGSRSEEILFDASAVGCPAPQGPDLSDRWELPAVAGVREVPPPLPQGPRQLVPRPRPGFLDRTLWAFVDAVDAQLLSPLVQLFAAWYERVLRRGRR